MVSNYVCSILERLFFRKIFYQNPQKISILKQWRTLIAIFWAFETPIGSLPDRGCGVTANFKLVFWSDWKNNLKECKESYKTFCIFKRFFFFSNYLGKPIWHEIIQFTTSNKQVVCKSVTGVTVSVSFQSFWKYFATVSPRHNKSWISIDFPCSPKSQIILHKSYFWWL